MHVLQEPAADFQYQAGETGKAGRMTFAETLQQTFDSVAFDHPDYPEQPGSVRCCGALVLMRNGVIVCPRCGKNVAKPIAAKL
jgi:hypothetical protein